MLNLAICSQQCQNPQLRWWRPQDLLHSTHLAWHSELFVYLVQLRLYSRRARFLWYLFNFIKCYKNNGNIGISIFSDLWIWFWDSEFAFTCHQTDLFMVPPIPSTAPLPWNVTKEFQIKLVENSFSDLCKLENKYRCLNCELTPSLNTLISLIHEYAWTIKYFGHEYVYSILCMIQIIWYDCKTLFPMFINPSMSSKYSNLLVGPMSRLNFILL